MTMQTEIINDAMHTTSDAIPAIQTDGETTHEAHQLQELLTRLTGLFTIDRIYLYSFDYNEEITKKDLIILIPNSNKLHLSEAMPLANMVMTDCKAYGVRLFYTNDARRALKEGSLLFYGICKPENLIYNRKKGAEELLPSGLSANAIYDKAKKNFEKEKKKISSFEEGGKFYMDSGNLPMSAFMFHQVIELCFRAMEIVILGREKISHSIRNHQKIMQHYVPELGNLFTRDDGEPMSFVELLDEAYRAVRYENDYVVDKHQAFVFETAAATAKSVTNLLFTRTALEFSKKYLENKAQPAVKSVEAHESAALLEYPDPTDRIDQTDILQKIIAHITSKVAVSRIYQIGHRNVSTSHEGICTNTKQVNEHFDLLIIIDGVCNQNAFDVQGTLNNNTDIPASVSLWVHSRKSIEESLMDIENGYFFHEVLNSGNLIYKSPGDSGFETVENYDKVKLACAKDYTWFNRSNRANALMNAVSNIDDDDTGLVEMWLLHQSMEQICLGFIFIMIGYKPNQYSLTHLFGICRCISPIFEEIFPTEHTADKELFKVLVNTGRKLRYSNHGVLDLADTQMLLRRGRAWMAKAEELCQTAKASVVVVSDRERGIL